MGLFGPSKNNGADTVVTLPRQLLSKAERFVEDFKRRPRWVWGTGPGNPTAEVAEYTGELVIHDGVQNRYGVVRVPKEAAYALGQWIVDTYGPDS